MAVTHHWPLAGNILMHCYNNDSWQESLKAMNFSWKKWWRYIIFTSWNYWMILLLKQWMNEHYRYCHYSSKVIFSQNIVLKFWSALLKLPKTAFQFFHKILQKTWKKFLANPIFFIKDIVEQFENLNQVWILENRIVAMLISQF